MRRLCVLMLASVVGACDGPSPVAPTPVAQTPPPVLPAPAPVAVASVRDIALGERVEGIFGDGGRLPVEGGRRYLIAVGLAGADWLPEDPFVLTTRLVP